ncbi:MAG: cell division protein FtsL [Burkholderiales bacterium]|nr:cell division protein FtsL [Burkholderiales bacterium]
MIIRPINIVLIIVMIAYGVILVTQRYKARLHYTKLENLQKQYLVYEEEYTKLQLEAGTYSSGLVLQNFAYNKLGLVAPDSKHIVRVK